MDFIMKCRKDLEKGAGIVQNRLELFSDFLWKLRMAMARRLRLKRLSGAAAAGVSALISTAQL